MHPPPFLLTHHLSDWPDCQLELKCCKGVSLYPTKLLIQKHGDLAFQTVLKRLKCAACGKQPSPVYLCAGHRNHSGGAAADWSIELVS